MLIEGECVLSGGKYDARKWREIIIKGVRLTARIVQFIDLRNKEIPTESTWGIKGS